MEPVTWGFIGALAGSVIGATASISTTALNIWNTTRLQRNTNYLERKERSRAYQREILLEMQDALQDATRFMVKAHLEDESEYIKTGEWGRALLSEKIDQKLLDSNRRMSILTERIENDDLRSELKIFRNKISDALFSKSENEAKVIVADVSSSFTELMEKLGETLRSNY